MDLVDPVAKVREAIELHELTRGVAGADEELRGRKRRVSDLGAKYFEAVTGLGDRARGDAIAKLLVEFAPRAPPPS